MKTRAFDGERLKQARQAKGLSQSQLAGRIGAHVTSISDWERGSNGPSGRHVASLSRELGIDVGEFYGDEDDEESDPMRRAAEGLVSALTAELRRAADRESGGVS